MTDMTQPVEAASQPALDRMEPGLSPRLVRLREQALAFANEPDPTERGWAVMKSYDQTRAEPMSLRRAKAVRAYLRAETLTLDAGDLLAGRVRRGIYAHNTYREYAWVEAAAYPDVAPAPHLLEDAPVSPEFIAFMKEWATRHVPIQARVAALRPQETRDAMSCGVFSASGISMVHRLPRFQVILDRGALALRAETQERLDQLDATRAENVPKRIFYESIGIVYDTMVDYGNRWRKRLFDLAETERDPARKNELAQMADHCGHGLARPARTFREALQAVWLIVVINQADTRGAAGSLGRLDQYLYPFYRADIDAGRLTRGQALELIECLFLKCHRTFDFHHTMIGGLTPEGRDAVNDLSFLCLEAVERLKTPRDVAVRLHRHTPSAFLRKAAGVARLGLGRPDFWNDDVMVPALRKNGIAIGDARDYAAIGCVEITIPGKCNSRTMGHAINPAKILEITLNGGRCALTGKQVGLPNGTDFPTYESLHTAYRKQAARFIQLAIAENIRGYVLQATEHPFPILSALTEGCMASGRDVMAGGAVYNPAGVNLFGIANAADALAAVKRCVYEEKDLSLDDLRDALRDDFEGREDLRQRLLNRLPKFGNDDPYVDDIVSEEVAFYCDEVARYPTPEGGRHHPLLFGCTPASVHGMGPRTAASADGRHAKAPLATSVNPTHGRELSGATAVLNSICRIDFTKAPGGSSFILDLHPSAVAGDRGLDNLVDLLRTFIDQGGAEIGLNVVGEDQLRDAQAHPDDYAHLMVRIFGFSTWFTALDPDLQEELIQKTKHRR